MPNYPSALNVDDEPGIADTLPYRLRAQALRTGGNA